MTSPDLARSLWWNNGEAASQATREVAIAYVQQPVLFISFASCCLTSTEARRLIRDGGQNGKGDDRVKARQRKPSEKGPERPWTAARTMEVLWRCPPYHCPATCGVFCVCLCNLCTAQLLFQLLCWTESLRQCRLYWLLTNNLDNSKQKTSNLLSPAPSPYSWSLLGKCEGPAPPPSSKISWPFDLAWNPEQQRAPSIGLRHLPTTAITDYTTEEAFLTSGIC